MGKRECIKFNGPCYLHERFPCEADDKTLFCPFQKSSKTKWEQKLANVEAEMEIKR